MSGVAGPFFDNIRVGGPDGIRKPMEAGVADFALTQFKTINASTVGGSAVTNTITLVPLVNSAGSDTAGSGVAGGAEASVIVVTGGGSSTTTLQLSNAFPGKIYALYNHTGQSSNLTFKVTGQSGVTLADGSHCMCACNATDIFQMTAAY